MSNAKKIVENSRRNLEDAVRNKRKKKVKVDFEALDDAIVDGKLLVEVRAPVAFERYVYGKDFEVHTGMVMSIAANGTVELWDEQREQGYAVKLGEAHPRVKSLLPIPKVKSLENPRPQGTNSGSTGA